MLKLSLEAIELVDAIARYGSFASAAERLHKVPSTISYAVSKLEEQLGLNLFMRNGPRVSLTPAGEELLKEGRWLLAAAARYLGSELTPDGRPLDAVARFHLGNGARVERLNWAGDPSSKGQKQSYGLMVNYLYDLKRIDKHRSLLAQGKVPASKDIESLCP